MYVESREYYKTRNEEALMDIEYVDACAGMAERYKQIYDAEKDRKGICHGFIAEIAKHQNQIWVDRGMKVANKRLGILLGDVQTLVNYIDSIKNNESGLA